jgi:Cyclic phosphodiesterase-like protein
MIKSLDVLGEPSLLMSKRTAIVYWLLPSRDKRELFCEIIRILYKEFQAPNFEPHLTVFATKENRPSPKKVFETQFAPVRLQVRSVGFSSQFTKTVFIRFMPSNPLNKLAADLAHATNSLPKPVRDPHLSLVYKNIPVATKRELARTIKLPFREVLFDSIAAVRCISPTKTKADVEAWRLIARKSLRG